MSNELMRRVDAITLELERLSRLAYLVRDVAEQRSHGREYSVWAGVGGAAHQLGEQCDRLRTDVASLVLDDVEESRERDHRTRPREEDV